MVIAKTRHKRYAPRKEIWISGMMKKNGYDNLETQVSKERQSSEHIYAIANDSESC